MSESLIVVVGCRFVSNHNAIRRVSPRSLVLSREVPETAASILRVERALGSQCPQYRLARKQPGLLRTIGEARRAHGHPTLAGRILLPWRHRDGLRIPHLNMHGKERFLLETSLFVNDPNNLSRSRSSRSWPNPSVPSRLLRTLAHIGIKSGN